MLLLLSQSCHEGNCPFLLIECQACKGVITLNDKERHSERECPERNLNCKYCKLLFYFPDIKVRESQHAHRQAWSYATRRQGEECWMSLLQPTCAALERSRGRCYCAERLQGSPASMCTVNRCSHVTMVLPKGVIPDFFQ